MLTFLSKWILKLLGWSTLADFPDAKKYVVVAAPHTSNWDFPLGILAAKALKLEIRWIGKHTLFRWPYAWFFRAIGGIPVYRDASHDLIKQIAAIFDASDELVMAVAPEGTRSKTDHWKTGFWHIAKAANVPIALAFLDFGKKQVGLGGTFFPTDDIEKDFDLIRNYYKGHRGKNPANESLIQLVGK